MKKYKIGIRSQVSTTSQDEEEGEEVEEGEVKKPKPTYRKKK